MEAWSAAESVGSARFRTVTSSPTTRQLRASAASAPLAAPAAGASRSPGASRARIDHATIRVSSSGRRDGVLLGQDILDAHPGRIVQGRAVDDQLGDIALPGAILEIAIPGNRVGRDIGCGHDGQQAELIEGKLGRPAVDGLSVQIGLSVDQIRGNLAEVAVVDAAAVFRVEEGGKGVAANPEFCRRPVVGQGGQAGRRDFRQDGEDRPNRGDLGEVKPGVHATETHCRLAIGGGDGWRGLAKSIVNGVVALGAQVCAFGLLVP